MKCTLFVFCSMLYAASLSAQIGNNATLRGLTVSGDRLPGFSSGETSYSVMLHCGASALDFEATPFCGGRVLYFVGSASVTSPLDISENETTTLTILSIAED